MQKLDVQESVKANGIWFTGAFEKTLLLAPLFGVSPSIGVRLSHFDYESPE
jgi:hypothetical protein